MKKSKVTRSLLAACSIVALTAVLHGCLHSGGGPTYSQLDLMGGHNTAAGATVTAGSYGIDGLPDDLASALEGYTGPTTAGAGEALTIGGYTFTCGAASSCSVTVSDDETHFTTTGTINVALTSAVMPPPDPAIAERAAIAGAIAAANTAVGMVDDDASDDTVAAADAAIAAAKKAIADAANVPAAEKAANTGTVSAIETTLANAKASRTAAMMAADDAMTAAMAKTGKDLFAALAGNATADTTALNNAAVTDTDLSDGLAVDAAAGAGALADATDPASVTLEAGDSAGSLGGWAGMNFAHMNAETKVENAAVVYNNQGPGASKSFTELGYTVATATSGDDIKGYVTLAATDDPTLARIGGAAFEHSGTQNHPQADRADAVYIRGTYDGAPGEYRCTGTCTSTNDGKGSPSALGGTTWHFKPDAGVNAMAHQPDANYLYYGWWVSKDKDGDPTAASAFTGVNGAIAVPTSGTDSPEDLTGSATYNGHAAGKFALDYSQNAVLDGASDGGHFTADASLTATFGAIAAPTNGGISGTLDNFMANGESVDWSVTLHHAPWGTAGAFATPTTDVGTTMADETKGTTWSIGGVAADRSGTWNGQMYDEMPGNAPEGDGSNIPTTVTGTFYSEYSNVGRMVGAFGADNQ